MSGGLTLKGHRIRMDVVSQVIHDPLDVRLHGARLRGTLRDLESTNLTVIKYI